MVRSKRATAARTADETAESSKEDYEMARSALLAAVEECGGAADNHESHNAFLELFSFSNASIPIRPHLTEKAQRSLLLETMRNHLAKAAARRFFSGLSGVLHTAIEQEEETNSRLSLLLHYAVLTVQAYVDGVVEKRSNPKAQLPIVEEALQVATTLHHVGFPVAEDCHDTHTRGLLVKLCETWWLQKGPNRHLLVANALPLLVQSAVEETTKSSVSRLWTMREALTVIDWTCEESRDCKGLLLRLASCPHVLKKQASSSFTGRRLLSYLLLFDEGALLADLHQAMRVQLPLAKKTLLEAYGQVYLAAWKQASDTDEARMDDHDDDHDDDATSLQARYESTVLGDLVHAVLYGAHPALTKALRTVLQPLHDAHTTPAKNLLHRLYGPLLWRSLQAAHPHVRVNATLILPHVFPCAHADTAAAVQRACTSLEAVLVDRHAPVRVAAAQATAHILLTYWQVLSADQIRSLLNHIVTEHASDASSAAVRAGALDAVALLLQTPQSHAVLRPLLPRLGNLIHDKVERVRLATVRLLERIKATSGMKYYHTVPVQHLTARLAAEPHPTGPVATHLTALMLNSYFPRKATAVEQMQRTLVFLQTQPQAAAVFYANVATHLGVATTAKLAAMMLRCLVTAVEHDNLDDDNANDNGLILSASDTSLMAQVAETVTRLLESVQASLDEQAVAEFVAVEFGAPKLLDVLKHFEQRLAGSDASNDDDCARVCQALVQTATLLDPSTRQGVVAHVTTQLASTLATDLDSSYVSLLLVHHPHQTVTWLAHALESAFEADHALLFSSPVGDSKKRKSGRRQKKPSNHTANAPTLLPSDRALHVVQDLLKRPATRNVLLTSASLPSLQSTLHRGIRHAARVLADATYMESLRADELDYILGVSETYGRLALHRAAAAADTLQLSETLDVLLEWTSTKVVAGMQEAVPFDPNLSTITVGTPLSPVPTGPLRRRPNRHQTPTSKNNASVSRVSDNHTAFLSSLLQSSCLLFGEWLAVGGQGASEIHRHATGWCQAVASDKTPLVAALMRLAMQLARQESFGLLAQVLVRLESEVVAKGLSTLMQSVRLNPTLLTQTVQCVLEAARTVGTAWQESDDKDEMPRNLADLWPLAQGNSVHAALTIVLGSPPARKALVQQLLESSSSMTTGMEGPLLALLLHEAPEMAAVIRQATMTNSSVELPTHVQELLDSVA